MILIFGRIIILLNCRPAGLLRLRVHHVPDLERAHQPAGQALQEGPGTNCIKIGLPGKLILSKRKGLWEVLFS